MAASFPRAGYGAFGVQGVGQERQKGLADLQDSNKKSQIHSGMLQFLGCSSHDLA